MPDISMCNSLVCKKRLQCYRWVAEADHIQSFARFADCNEEHGYPNFIQATDEEINDYLKREGIIQ